jgi:hypothetical protein
LTVSTFLQEQVATHHGKAILAIRWVCEQAGGSRREAEMCEKLHVVGIDRGKPAAAADHSRKGSLFPPIRDSRTSASLEGQSEDNADPKVENACGRASYGTGMRRTTKPCVESDSRAPGICSAT